LELYAHQIRISKSLSNKIEGAKLKTWKWQGIICVKPVEVSSLMFWEVSSRICKISIASAYYTNDSAA